MLVEVTNYEQQVLRSKGDVIVEFYAPWCKPCSAMEPALVKASEKVTVMRWDVEKLATPRSCNIQSIPTLVHFVDGQPHNALVGHKSYEQIMGMLS